MSKALLQLFEGDYTSDGSGIIPDGTAAYFPNPGTRMRYAVGEDEEGPFLQMTVLDDGHVPEGIDGVKFRVCGSQVMATGIQLAQNRMVTDIICLEDWDESGKRAIFHIVNFTIDGRSLFGAWKCPPD